MAVAYQDYYQTLGVDRQATQDQIKQAYHDLAKKHHPDVSREPDAEAKFKQISEAYTVLSDPDKRKKFDTLGPNWKSGESFTPPPGFDGFRFQFSSDGDGLGAGGFSDFFSSLFGGDLGDLGASFGRRRKKKLRRAGRDHEATLRIPFDLAVRGGTTSFALGSSGADGSMTSRSYEVNIPQGTLDGQVIRLAGQGEAGLGGADAGNLLLKIQVEPHPRFRLNGRDVHVTVLVSPWEAALGGTIPVETLDGIVELTIPEGSQTGQKLRLKGRGVAKSGAGQGDMIVELAIAVPHHVSGEERELFQKLARVSSFDPRQGH